MDYVEKFYSFSITKLKNWGYLKSKMDLFSLSCNWIKYGEKEASVGFNLINVNENLKELILKYSIDGRSINYNAN